MRASRSTVAAAFQRLLRKSKEWTMKSSYSLWLTSLLLSLLLLLKRSHSKLDEEAALKTIQKVLLGEAASAPHDDETDESDEEDYDEGDYPNCIDLRANCEKWAAEGDCDKNSEWMHPHCPRSCKKCHNQIRTVPKSQAFSPDSKKATIITDVMGADIGVPQIFPAAIHRNRTDVETRIEQAQKYVKFVINKQERYKSVRELCRNNDPKCAQWAVEGWCQEQDEEMTKNCAPVCFACEELHVDAKCPVDPYARNSWYPGDLNKMFHRILRDFADRFDITVLSRPDYAPGDDENSDVDYIIGPWVLTLDGFLSDKEADRFIELGAEGGRGFQRSKGAGKPDEQGYYTQLTSDTQRTSSNNWCNYDACYDDPHSLAVHERIENLTRIPRENAEHLQILRYEQGEFYKTHHDYIPYEKDRQSGPRILTVFLYLNDVEAGGGTNFPGLDLTVQPKKGRVLLWPSVKDEAPFEVDLRTFHEALPVERGVKYAANAWFHQREVVDGC